MDLISGAILFLIFVFGLIFGSFFNVLVFRLNTSEKNLPKFWQGRSICPKCRKVIAWYNNIPLVSFLLLMGKCRSCKKPISWQYPVVELVTGIVTVMILGKKFLSDSPIDLVTIVSSLAILIMAYTFIVIFFSDLVYGLIPDEVVLVGIATGFAYNWLFQKMNFETNLIVAAASALAFFLVVLATKFRGMGFGDVKLAFFLGLVLGWPTAAVGFWIAFVFGGVFGVAVLALKRMRLSATIPLGPFLIIGATMSALWSVKLLQFLGVF